MRSHYEERYGKSFIPKDMTIQDFGVSYEELEPFFDFAEKVFGTSGQAWTVKGQLVGQGKGGNPYAPDRSNPFPLSVRRTPFPHSCLRRRRRSRLQTLQPAIGEYFQGRTPIPMARRWARATSAVSAAATSATCIPRHRRT